MRAGSPTFKNRDAGPKFYVDRSAATHVLRTYTHVHVPYMRVSMQSRIYSSHSKAFNATHVVKWENGKVVKSEMSWKALF